MCFCFVNSFVSFVFVASESSIHYKLAIVAYNIMNTMTPNNLYKIVKQQCKFHNLNALNKIVIIMRELWGTLITFW